MKKQFENLVNILNKYDLYQVGDEVDDAIQELSKAIKEGEGRLILVSKCATDIDKVISKFTNAVDEESDRLPIITLADHDSIKMNVISIGIACDLSDDRCVKENWNNLFVDENHPVEVNLMEGLIGNFLTELTNKIPNFYCERQSGSYFIDNNTTQVYCTPFWEEEKDIAIDIHNIDGDLISHYKIIEEYPSTLKEFELFKENYTNLLHSLNARFEFGFLKWLVSDNVVGNTLGYKTQCSQYSKVFTIDELVAYYKREYGN